MLTWPLAIGRDLVRVLPQAGQGFFEHRCTQQAAGIAYRMLFALAPLAILLVSVLGLVLENDDVRDDLVDYVVEALPVSPEGAQQVEDAIVAIATPTSAIGFASLIVFAWSASGMMAAIRTGLETAMQVEERRPAVRGKLVDLLLVAGTALLVLAVAAFGVLGEPVRSALTRVAAIATVEESTLGKNVAVLGVPFLVSIGVVLLLYRFVPARRIRSRDALAGAIVTAVCIAGIALATGWIYTKAGRYSVVYGSLTTALVFLYSIYLYACALLFGAEVASAWSRPPEEAGGSMRFQVEQAVRGLFFRPKEEDEKPRDLDVRR